MRRRNGGGSSAVAKLLLDHGASTEDATTPTATSMIVLAALASNARLLAVLLNVGGADVDAIGFDGRSVAAQLNPSLAATAAAAARGGGTQRANDNVVNIALSRGTKMILAENGIFV